MKTSWTLHLNSFGALMERASAEQVSMSTEEICSTHSLLYTGTLTNTVYEVNSSTAALPEQLLTTAIDLGIQVILILEKSIQIGSTLQYFMSIFPHKQVLRVMY